MSEILDPFENLVFNAEGCLVELAASPTRDYGPPPTLDWAPVADVAQERPVAGMWACVTKAQGPLWNARVVNEPFTEGGITYVYVCPEADFWRWWCSPAETRTPRPRAKCWPASQVWVLKEHGLTTSPMPEDPFA